MSQQLTVQPKATLPTIQELRDEAGLEILSRENQLNVLLNQNPPDSWYREHPYAKRKILRDGKIVEVPAIYLPVERQEWLMTRIFINWWLELKSYSLVANSVACAVRLHYQNPVTNEWLMMDGVGAAPLQTDKGAGATEFDKVKSSAVQMALPAAKTFGFKDACENIGKLFGKDANRLGDIDYVALLNQIEVEDMPLPYPRTALMENGSPLESLTAYIKDITTESKTASRGRNKGKEVTLYTLILSDGSRVSTFDEEMAIKANQLLTLEKQALIEYRMGVNGRKLLSITEA